MTAVYLKVYPIISRAVEEGVACGIRRAYKHINNPTEDVLQENIEREVMNALSEVIDYDRSEGIKPEQ